MSGFFRPCFAALSVLCVLLAVPALAGPLDGSLNGALKTRVLPGWRAADGRHVAALQFTLAPGWKTYWRAPGDAGISPRFDWRGSQNLSGVEVSWPAPVIFDQGGVRTIGYVEELILPLYLTPKQAGQDIRLSGRIELGVCSDVCVPMTVEVAQDLPGAQARRDPMIAAALAARPYSAQEGGVGRVACRITPTEDGIEVRAEIDLPPSLGAEMIVIEADNPRLWVAQGETRRSGGRLRVDTQIYHVDGRAFALDRSGLLITILGGAQAVEIKGCPTG